MRSHTLLALDEHSGLRLLTDGSVVLELFHIKKHFIYFLDSLVRLLFKVVDLCAQSLSLRRRSCALFPKDCDVLVLFFDGIQGLITLANLLDLVGHLLLNWIVIDSQLDDGLV